MAFAALAGCNDDMINSDGSGSATPSQAKTSVTTTTPATTASPPVITLTASPTTVSSLGVSTLSWSATNAQGCYANDGWRGPLVTSGTWSTGKLSNTTEYELSCTGHGGVATQSVTVTVSAPSPSITLSASPSTVSTGSASVISWNSTNSTECTASGAWSGSKATSGSASTGALNQNSTYSLTCLGAGGSTSQSTTVSVASAGPSISLSASASTVNSGGSTALTWTAANATSCSASGGWTGSKAIQGTQSVGPLTANETYTLSCTGAGGTASQSTVVSVKSPAPAVNLSVGPSAVASGGSSTLSWSSSNATACVADGGWSGNKALSGSQSTGALTANTTFKLRCEGPGGGAVADAFVSVNKVATVALNISKSVVAAGGTATLSWSSTNTTLCTASGGWSGTKPTTGSQVSGTISSNTTYTLTCTGPDGASAIASRSVSVKTSEAAPTVNFAASATTIASGQSATLSWSTSNATTCTASGNWSGNQAMSGSYSTGALTANAAYTLACAGAGGTTTQSAAITVTQSAPTVAISASPNSIKSGSSAMISWSSSNATACSAAGGWSGSKSVSGSQSTGAITTNASYSLTCTGTGGSATQNTAVSVTSTAPAPSITLSATPSTVVSGGSSTLNWSTTNATACSASGGWSGGEATSGSHSTGALTANTTFTLTCTGTGGSATQTATVSVTTPAPTVTLTANPSTVSTGASATLSWSSTNATSCVSSGAWSGSQATQGSKSTGALTGNSTYTLTCSGSGGSAAQSSTVTVTTPAPTVTLAASPATVASGAQATLTWSSANATSCAASGGWSGSQPTSGSSNTSAVTATTKYVLTCTGAGGSASQSSTVSTVAAPTVSLSASPTSVTSGGSSTLTWSASNASSCTASGGWSGAVATSGSQSTGALSSSTTYTVTCTGSGGSSTQSAVVAVSSGSSPAGASCSATSGSLVLKASATRVSGISPLLVFFDATGTTDSSVSGNTTSFQNVAYNWSFGDNNPSGTGTWGFGANAGHNSKNSATGGVGAHLYVTPGEDTSYTVTVTADDGTNTASCNLGVTAYDPAGANGFAGSATTCVASSSTPVAGSGGCPVGANVMRQSSLGTAFSSAFGSGKQLLFHCGDTFSGTGNIAAGTKGATVGAYGGCENSSSDRPIFSNTGGGSAAINFNFTPGPSDIRIDDIDFEGGGTGLVAVSTQSNGQNGGPYWANQITLYNLYANGLTSAYYMADATQSGIIQSQMTGMGDREGTFWNYAGNWCLTYSSSCTEFVAIQYNAFIGNNFNGQGNNTSNTWETFRIGACRMCVYENNTFQNASSTGGATLKMSGGNDGAGSNPSIFSGQYVEFVEMADNLIQGTSGAQVVELSPENAQFDERLRNYVVERNIFMGKQNGATQILVSAQNVTLRDNVFNMNTAGGGTGATISQRGTAAYGCADCSQYPTQYIQFYNNTCYDGTCANFGGYGAPSNNSIAKNNLCYEGGCISNSGSGNTIANNTSNTSADPNWTNGSGTFQLLTDWKPTANYSGGTTVPVVYDALGDLLASWPLGAVN